MSELIDLRWDQIDFKHGLIHINRLKHGTPSTHPLRGVELRALHQMQRKYSEDSPYVFVSECGGLLTDSSGRKIVARAGELAGLPFLVHPHILRHAAGYHLASKGHDKRAIQAYLNHWNMMHTVRYIELVLGRFNDFWKD